MKRVAVLFVLLAAGCAGTGVETPAFPDEPTAGSVESFAVAQERAIRTRWVRDRAGPTTEVTVAVGAVTVTRTGDGYLVTIRYRATWTAGVGGRESVTDARYVAAYFVTDRLARRTVTASGTPPDPRNGTVVRRDE